MSLTHRRTGKAFYNPLFKERNSYITLRIVLFLFGLPFAAVPTIGFISVIANGDLQGLDILLVGLIVSSFLLSGLVMMIVPNLKTFVFRHNWRSLEFRKDKIFIVGKIKLKVIKIDSKDIHSIELEQYTKYSRNTPENSNIIITEVQFHIKLRINLVNKKALLY